KVLPGNTGDTGKEDEARIATRNERVRQEIPIGPAHRRLRQAFNIAPDRVEKIEAEWALIVEATQVVSILLGGQKRLSRALRKLRVTSRVCPRFTASLATDVVRILRADVRRFERPVCGVTHQVTELSEGVVLATVHRRAVIFV